LKSAVITTLPNVSTSFQGLTLPTAKTFKKVFSIKFSKISLKIQYKLTLLPPSK